jgi:CheY-like chemotaxis protein
MANAMQILVVDDDTDAADSLAELFEMEDHDVTVVYSGEKAIAAFQDNTFDMAFMDIMMPGKNGVDSFFEIRKSTPDAKVYFMTGYSTGDLVERALAEGALGVLPKPLDPEELLTVLH